MVSSEVQRTLVKSPPELWAELSDPAALARHLGELGEIRIVATKPEERVEWEAENATGTVLIKASGWGTKVTLSVTREVVEPASAEPEAQEPQAEQQAVAWDVAREVAEPEAVAPEAKEPQPEVAPETTEAIKPRRGFFSRLFRRRPQAGGDPIPASEQAAHDTPQQASADTPPQPAAETHRSGTSPQIAADMPAETPPQTATEAPAEPPADISAELREAEEAATEEVTAVLTAVLDRLGAAHHRPFSRA